MRRALRYLAGTFKRGNGYPEFNENHASFAPGINFFIPKNTNPANKPEIFI